MRRTSSGRALLGALLCLAPAVAAADVLHRSGPPEDRFDLVILADGYQAAQQAEFEAEARRVFETLRRTEPFAHYLGLLNVTTGFRASRRTGPGEDTAYGTVFKKTFGTTFYASRRTLVLSDAIRAGGEADAVLVIVPSNRRGGTALGNLCFITTGSGPAVAMHELGHAIGGLGDEYTSWSGSPSLGVEATAQRYPNLTQERSRERLPWKDWVEPSTPVPATLFSRSGVSAYQGGGAYSSGIYRPRWSCRMRSDTTEFCEVCRQHLVLSLHEESSPLALSVSATPSGQRVRIASSLPPGAWRVSWSGVQATGLEAVIPAGTVATVRLEDATPWVRGSWRSELRYRFVVDGGPAPGVAPRPARISGVTTRLRVRAQPELSAAVLGYLGPDEAIAVTGAAVDGFYPIEFQGGRGFMATDFVSFAAPAGAGLARRVTGTIQ